MSKSVESSGSQKRGGSKKRSNKLGEVPKQAREESRRALAARRGVALCVLAPGGGSCYLHLALFSLFGLFGRFRLFGLLFILFGAAYSDELAKFDLFDLFGLFALFGRCDLIGYFGLGPRVPK